MYETSAMAPEETKNNVVEEVDQWKNYSHCGNRTSDWESTKCGVTSDESKINAKMEDHLKDSEMEAKEKNPWDGLV